MAIVIRTASVADALAIAQVNVSAWRDAYRHIFPESLFETQTIEGRTESWERLLRGEGEADAGAIKVFVAEDGGEIVGYASAGRSRDPGAEGIGEVHSLYVAPLRWRQGIGHDLMATASDYLRSAGFGEATLWVLQANRQGRSFYEKEGWQADGATQPVPRASEVLELRYRLSLT